LQATLVASGDVQPIRFDSIQSKTAERERPSKEKRKKPLVESAKSKEKIATPKARVRNPIS